MRDDLLHRAVWLAWLGFALERGINSEIGACVTRKFVRHVNQSVSGVVNFSAVAFKTILFVDQLTGLGDQRYSALDSEVYFLHFVDIFCFNETLI
jgi:hypothetical protein